MRIHRLYLPALRARQGDWVYYVTFMKYSDIAERVKNAGEIHEAESLKDLLQRELTRRAEKIRAYIENQPQRFFNALVVGTYGGHPKFIELEMDRAARKWPGYVDGAAGFLRLDGEETLFAIDGQHRVAGIAASLKKSRKFADEEICVIFVKGVGASSRRADPEGFERTRRLFTTLNRHAKKVTKSEIVALDEDDIAAIMARDLVEDYPLFKGKTSTGKQASLQSSDKTSFTHIVTLYSVLRTLIAHKHGKSILKESRPSQDIYNKVLLEIKDFWHTFSTTIPTVKELLGNDSTVVEKHRHSDGGDLLYRPIGLTLAIDIITDLMVHLKLPIPDACQAFQRLPRELSADPWAGLLWDPVNHRIISAAKNRAVARRIGSYGLGVPLASLKTDEANLRNELSGLLNKSVGETSLNRYL